MSHVNTYQQFTPTAESTGETNNPNRMTKPYLIHGAVAVRNLYGPYLAQPIPAVANCMDPESFSAVSILLSVKQDTHYF